MAKGEQRYKVRKDKRRTEEKEKSENFQNAN